MKPLKPSIHLIYGIIIGILLMACSGSDNTTSNTASNQENTASTTNTATPTNSSGIQKVVLCDQYGSLLTTLPVTVCKSNGTVMGDSVDPFGVVIVR